MARSILSIIRDKFKALIWSDQKSQLPTPPVAPLPPSPTPPPPKVGNEGGREIDSSKRQGRRKRRKPSIPIDKEAEQKNHAPWDISLFHVIPVEGKTRFHDLGISDLILHAIFDAGFKYCTPIQAAILPGALNGKDASGRAQTGTGKTAAFLITILNRILTHETPERNPGTPRSLILAPTRELAIQIAKDAETLSKYCPIKTVTLFGGMDYQKQQRLLSNGLCDIIVATPGRLLDFSKSHDVSLDRVEVLVIDEADRMLDMGFIPDMRQIIRSTPHKSKRQTLLFSATLTPEIHRLASQWQTDPIFVELEHEKIESDSIEQIVYLVTNEEKIALLYNIIALQNIRRAIVFCNRKSETRRLENLFNRYKINCAVLSGDISQNKRLKTLESFKSGNIRVLIATDVAGRGLHIEEISHVINYTLPNNPEDYVHRIGRTGRCGAVGISISFASEDDAFYLPDIEEYIGHSLPCIHPEESWLKLPESEPLPKKFRPYRYRSNRNERRQK